MRTDMRLAAFFQSTWIIIALLSALSGCTSQLKGQQTAQSSDPAEDSDLRRLMQTQIPLIDLAERLKFSDGARANLGGIELDVENKIIRVWWKGTIGDSQRAIAQDGKSHSIKVSFQPAKYSRVELKSAINSYVYRRSEVPTDLVSLAPRIDGSGVQVAMAHPFDATTLKLGVDSFTTVSGRIVPMSREADTVPFSGGAVISTTTRQCSSGFAVNWNWSIDRRGGSGLLTAAHCEGLNATFFTTGAGLLIGRPWEPPLSNDPANDFRTDSLLIISGPPTQASIFTGGIGSQATMSPVVAGIQVWPGVIVCFSGAFGGSHCGLHVDSIDNVFFGGVPAFNEAVALASYAPRKGRFLGLGLKQGDSGGPVYGLAGNAVVAAGTIIGYVTECPAGQRIGLLCKNSLAFADMTVLAYHNVSLMTQ
jgi:hypothetical protein